MPEVIAAISLVMRLAWVLEGEAGPLGTIGFAAVGDTMLARREAGQSWDEVLSAYYGGAVPSVMARLTAEMMVHHPWQSQGMQFVYSEADRVRMGWPEGDLILRRGRWALHLARQWPGE
jgi:hypothetical protein